MNKKYKKHIIIECSKCGLEIILINNSDNRTAIVLDNMKCPFTKCSGGTLKVKMATDDYKECIDNKRTYKRVSGEIKQIK